MWRARWPRAERRLRRLCSGVVAWLRWLNGDVAYDAFIAHLRAHHPERPLPTRADFYRAETERRWNGVRRCC